MVYADYEFYTNTFLGTSLDEATFNQNAVRASSYLDYITMGKAEKNAGLHAIKLACCALAEEYHVFSEAQKRASSASGEVQSETVGSWSQTYRSGAETMEAAKNQMAYVAAQYLAHTGLLYRGRCCR